MTPTTPQDNTVCAVHCSDCEGDDHHWGYYGGEDENGEPVYSCKHCDATREIGLDDD